MNQTNRIPLRQLAPLVDTSLAAALFRGVESAPDAHGCTDATGSYTRHDELVTAAALSRVISGALGDGPNVALLAPPSANGAAINLALTLLNRIPVNLNPLAKLDKANRYIGTVEATHILGLGPMVRKMESEGKLSGQVLSLEDIIAEAAQPAVRQWAREAVNADPTTRAQNFPGLTAQLSDTAVILPTSGSTGFSKGVVLSHRSILSNVTAVVQHFGFGPQNKLLCSGPLNHALGFTGTVWAPVVTGVQRFYVPSMALVKETLETIVANQIDLFLTIPTIMGMCIRKADENTFKSIKNLVLGAEPLSAALRAAISKFLPAGVRVNNFLGLTEMGPVVASTHDANIVLDDGRFVYGYSDESAGLPMPGVYIEIRHPETGELMANGQTGMIYVTGPGIFDRYYGDEQKTTAAFAHGAYITGDLGYLDPVGRIVVKGRAFESPKIGGEFVPVLDSTATLIAVTGMDPQSARVTFVPDSAKGSRLVVLHTADLTMTPAEICKAMRAAGLSESATPKQTEFHRIEAFPMNNGKVDIIGTQEIAKQLSPEK